MTTLRLPSGLVLQSFAVPTASFSFGAATDEQRAAVGFPRLPQALDLQSRLDEKANSFRLIEPIFRPRESRRRRLPGLKLIHAAESSSTWSGGITFPVGEQTMIWVEGTWSVPNGAAPTGASDGSQFAASTWVGIDGDDGSGDVLQAGCDVDVAVTSGSAQTTFAAWTEWYPAGSAWITNMPVSKDDVLNCVIRLQVGSTSTASIFFANTTTKVGLSFSVTAPDGTSLSGNCAEWIVEQLSVGPIANYGSVLFTGCKSGTSGGQTIPVGDGNTIEMINAKNKPISIPTIMSSTTVGVAYAGDD